MGARLLFPGCGSSSAVLPTPGRVRAAGHGVQLPNPATHAVPQQLPGVSQPSLRPSPPSHGLQMGFYCILFCNGGEDGPLAGIQRVVSPPNPGRTG